MKIQWWFLTALVAAVASVHAGTALHASAWATAHAHAFASASDPPVTKGILAP